MPSVPSPGVEVSTMVVKLTILARHRGQVGDAGVHRRQHHIWQHTPGAGGILTHPEYLTSPSQLAYNLRGESV